MRYKPISVFVVILIQVLIPKAVCEDPWLLDTFNALLKLSELAEIKSRSCLDETVRFNCYLEKLNEMLPTFEKFLTKSRLNEPIYRLKLRALVTGIRIVMDSGTMESVEELLSSSSLKEIYDSTVTPLLDTLKQDVLATTDSDGYVLPLETACSTLPTRNVPTISAKDVCPTLSECSRSFHSSTANACKEDNTCDVEKATPLMIGLLFYKVSFAFVDKFCSGRCPGDSGCNMEEEFASVVEQGCSNKEGLLEIGPAMEILSENDDKFSVARMACNEIEAEPACRVMTFYPNYLLLKKMKEERLNPGDTRDLTLYQNVDHAKIIQLKKDAIKHIELLSAIQQLDSNLQAQVHGIASYFKGIASFDQDTSAIKTELHDNQKQIDSLVTLVNKIKNNQADQIDDDAEMFIEQYSGYTPMVDRSRLAQNTAKWGAFKEYTCDLLNGVEGIGASPAKAVANGFLLCENLEGTIAEFDALRENIFDFQFELVDSLARVVRGNVAKKLANSIQGQQGDLLKADQLLGGFLMTQTFLQTQAWLYCDKLEYKNEGRRVQPCSPQTGLFTNSELDNVVAFTDHQTYISIERTVHIPSKPQFSGDLGFINIHTFSREKTASFRLPLNLNWLYKFDWSLIGESHAPYVESFQLFLPRNEYRTGSEKVKTSTRIVVSADTETGSYISADRESSVLYKLPEKQSSYVTVYQEGYRTSTCSNEIPNPYSLCNNLPKICHTSTKMAGDSLLPTTLSRWKATYTVQSGDQEVEWLTPNSMTDLKLIAKVTLRMLPRKPSSKRSSVPRTTDQPDVCCQGNTYRSSLVSSECEDCPSGSTSKLGGYYCEVDSTTLGPNKKQHVFLHGNSPKRRHSSASRVSSRSHKVNDKRRHSAASRVSSRSHKARRPKDVVNVAIHARHSNNDPVLSTSGDVYPTFVSRDSYRLALACSLKDIQKQVVLSFIFSLTTSSFTLMREKLISAPAIVSFKIRSRYFGRLYPTLYKCFN
ncbi:hypothetical protein OS493_008320 [Desmophyllum pertusum]|uniref:Uncharacterized protein n=1 Tax=Desmophyllum pertusum TaxID=174260 RepID=A0A9X0A5A1_9CNID|nr:hypothetical protein OS493_008320 [Desmophyllum pertusum]